VEWTKRGKIGHKLSVSCIGTLSKLEEEIRQTGISAWNNVDNTMEGRGGGNIGPWILKSAIALICSFLTPVHQSTC
jgi:hypothetical protein